mmetsp:Transcript_13746/g.48513  ORF Transcript_13746/g.48513 Transcript_13746/m.48513 type:complete len:226 (-) Transcript_13746:574-1251(-)
MPIEQQLRLPKRSGDARSATAGSSRSAAQASTHAPTFGLIDSSAKDPPPGPRPPWSGSRLGGCPPFVWSACPRRWRRWWAAAAGRTAERSDADPCAPSCFPPGRLARGRWALGSRCWPGRPPAQRPAPRGRAQSPRRRYAPPAPTPRRRGWSRPHRVSQTGRPRPAAAGRRRWPAARRLPRRRPRRSAGGRSSGSTATTLRRPWSRLSHPRARPQPQASRARLAP